MELELYHEHYNYEQNHWWFVGRREIVFSLLDDNLTKKTGLKILDIGCGTGLTMNFLAPYGEVTGLDVSEDALEFCRQRGLNNVTLGSADELPFDDNTFDLVFALDVLEHVENDYKAVQEIERVCKPNGLVLATVPAHQWLWTGFDRYNLHQRRYSSREFLNNFKKAKLSKIRFSYFNFFLFPVIAIIRILKKIFSGAERRGESYSDFKKHSKFTNSFFTKLFSFEATLIKSVNLPIGVSLIGLFKKNEHRT